MRYQAGVSYNNVAGVMKKSDRNTLNINTTLSYTYKNMIFRNVQTVMILTLCGTSAKNIGKSVKVINLSAP